MKVGAERKKVVILALLAVVGLYLFYANVLSQPSAPGEARGPRRPPLESAVRTTATQVAAAAPQGPVRRPNGRIRANEEFHPSLKRKPEERPDPMSIDPTLRLDLLAKVQAVTLEGGTRNLFQVSAPPPSAPKGSEPNIDPKKRGTKDDADRKPDPPVPSKPTPPPPPPIALKYFGYSTVRGDSRKKAFFLDGDDILVATEGELLKRRYRVVRIGVNSVVMEDTESKREDTLPLQEEAVAG